MVAQMDRQVRVQMGTRLEPMGPLENAAGAAKDWTKNSNVHRMVAGRAIQEPSICRNPKPSTQRKYSIATNAEQVSPSVESYAQADI